MFDSATSEKETNQNHRQNLQQEAEFVAAFSEEEKKELFDMAREIPLETVEVDAICEVLREIVELDLRQFSLLHEYRRIFTKIKLSEYTNKRLSPEEIRVALITICTNTIQGRTIYETVKQSNSPTGLANLTIEMLFLSICIMVDFDRQSNYFGSLKAYVDAPHTQKAAVLEALRGDLAGERGDKSLEECLRKFDFRLNQNYLNNVLKFSSNRSSAINTSAIPVNNRVVLIPPVETGRSSQGIEFLRFPGNDQSPGYLDHAPITFPGRGEQGMQDIEEQNQNPAGNQQPRKNKHNLPELRVQEALVTEIIYSTMIRRHPGLVKQIPNSHISGTSKEEILKNNIVKLIEKFLRNPTKKLSLEETCKILFSAKLKQTSKSNVKTTFCFRLKYNNQSLFDCSEKPVFLFLAQGIQIIPDPARIEIIPEQEKSREKHGKKRSRGRDKNNSTELRENRKRRKIVSDNNERVREQENEELLSPALENQQAQPSLRDMQSPVPRAATLIERPPITLSLVDEPDQNDSFLMSLVDDEHKKLEYAKAEMQRLQMEIAELQKSITSGPALKSSLPPTPQYELPPSVLNQGNLPAPPGMPLSPLPSASLEDRQYGFFPSAQFYPGFPVQYGIPQAQFPHGASPAFYGNLPLQFPSGGWLPQPQPSNFFRQDSTGTWVMHQQVPQQFQPSGPLTPVSQQTAPTRAGLLQFGTFASPHPQVPPQQSQKLQQSSESQKQGAEESKPWYKNCIVQ